MTNMPVRWEDVTELRVSGRQSATARYVIRKGFKVNVRGLGPGYTVGTGFRVVRLQRRSDGEEFVEVVKDRNKASRIVNATAIVFVRQAKA